MSLDLGYGRHSARLEKTRPDYEGVHRAPVPPQEANMTTTTTEPVPVTGYVVHFGRIGRTHDVPDLTAPTNDPDKIAELIYAYAEPRLLSRDVEVWVDLEVLRGGIRCGFNTGGTFTLTAADPTEDAQDGAELVNHGRGK